MSSNSTHLTHLKYRPDIDGLRAIAVLSVVGYHAFPNWFRGGFIGVDIFFVISGFLISSIIFSNLERNSFSLLEFYSRRIKRIFPALLLVMMTCLAFGWFVLFADEYRNLGKHIAGGAGFVSNFILWREIGYFDSGAETKPLLHLWSLAIEEQFYIFWPLLLIFVWKRKLSFVSITATVAAISFAVNIYAINKNPSAAFFLPFPRFWELMVGGLLAHIALHKPLLNRHKNFQSLVGIILLTLGFFLLNRDFAFPGWWALLPVFGAFFIISAGPNALFNKYILASKVFVWVGLISYPLYLWHWPILSFVHIIFITPSTETIITAVLSSVLLSWLTFRFIESRFRWSANNQTIIGLATVSIVLFFIGVVVLIGDGFREREVNKPFLNDDKKLFRLSRNSNESCYEKLKLNLVSEEVCLTNSNVPEILFAGDSHAMAVYSSIYAKRITIPSILISGHSCELYPNLEYTPTYQYSWNNNCTSIANEVINISKMTSTIKTIVLVNSFPSVSASKSSRYKVNGQYVTEEEAFLKGSGYLIEQLLKLGKEVIFVMDVPHLKFAPKDCEKRGVFENSNQCRYTRLELDESRRSYENLVKRLKDKYSTLKVFDPTDLYCDVKSCHLKDENGGVFYADSHHLSLYGSEKLLGALFGNINIPSIVKPSTLN